MNTLRIIPGKLGLPLPKGKWKEDCLGTGRQVLDEGSGPGPGQVPLGFPQAGLQCPPQWHCHLSDLQGQGPLLPLLPAPGTVLGRCSAEWLLQVFYPRLPLQEEAQLHWPSRLSGLVCAFNFITAHHHPQFN